MASKRPAGKTPAQQAPDPTRALGNVGTTFWREAWAQGKWLETIDTELLQIVCEQMDERVALRVRVLQGTDQRKELRDLDRMIVQGLQLLGFTPADRAARATSQHQSSWA